MKHLIERLPYKSQRNNSEEPAGTCNTTSCVNALHAIGIELPISGVKTEADYLTEYLKTPKMFAFAQAKYTDLLAKGNQPRHIYGCLAEAINRITDRQIAALGQYSYLDMAQNIIAGNPMVVGGMFTPYGHIVCVVGVELLDDADTEILQESDIIGFYVDDPWGDYTTGYRSLNGDNIFIYLETLRNILHGGSRPWGILFSNPERLAA